MNAKVFLTSDVDGLPSQSIQTMDSKKAYKIEQSGQGVVVNFGNLDAIENQIESAVNKYRKRYEEMISSPRPEFKVEGAIDFYANEMKAELEAEVTELNRQYAEIIAGIKDAAMRDLANKKRYISEEERKAARDIVSEAVTAIKFGDGRGALETLIDQAVYMTDSRKLALLQEIGRINEAATGHTFERALQDSAKKLYNKLDEVRSGEMLPVKIAQALPDSADYPYRRLKMTHVTFKDNKNNVHNPAKL